MSVTVNTYSMDAYVMFEVVSFIRIIRIRTPIGCCLLPGLLPQMIGLVRTCTVLTNVESDNLLPCN